MDKLTLRLRLFVFQCTGFIIFVVGVWSQIELYKYLKLSTEIPGTAPYVLIGTGALIMLIGSLACCCTIKGQPALLYMVIIADGYIYIYFFINIC